MSRARSSRAVLVSLLIPATALFLGTSAAATPVGAISQSYTTDSSNVSQGALLSVSASNSSVVAPANNGSNAGSLVGIAATKPLIELSNSGSSGVQVVVSGTTPALVSNLNGTINVGDKITASPVSGIGMKAIHSAEIVGTAQESLSQVPTMQESVTENNGSTTKITVGLIPVAVNVAYYSASSSQGTVSAFVPSFLQTIANALTGRQVSPLRVLLGAVSLLLGFISVTTMLYVSIRSGVISIGRNPLAERALRRGLVDVIVAAVGVLVMTIILVYAILLS